MSGPGSIPCHHCLASYAGAICPHCREERPAYTMLKNLTRNAPPAVRAPKPYPACQYAPAALCDCGQRGHCLETV